MPQVVVPHAPKEWSLIIIPIILTEKPLYALQVDTGHSGQASYIKNFFSAGNALFLGSRSSSSSSSFPFDILGQINGLFIAKMMGLSALGGLLATYLAVNKHHPSFNSAQSQTVDTQTDSAENALESEGVPDSQDPEKAKDHAVEQEIRDQYCYR